MANRTSYAPAGVSNEIPTGESIVSVPVNPISPKIFGEAVNIEVVKPGPNIKKNIVN